MRYLLSSILFWYILIGCTTQFTSDAGQKDQFSIAEDNKPRYQKGFNDAQLKIIENLRTKIGSRDYSQIRLLIDQLEITETSDSDVFRLASELLIDQKMPELALSVITKIKTKNEEDYRSIAKICAQILNHRCAAQAIFRLLYSNSSEQSEPELGLVNTLWNHLIASAEKPYIQQFGLDSRMVNLSKEFVTANSMDQKQKLWSEWKINNAGHPFEKVPPTVFRLIENFRKPNIAVILPLSGEFQSAGEAVRDGLVQSTFNEVRRLRGNLTFFDSEAQSMTSIIQMIDESDATHIIGPLLKQHCRAFVKASEGVDIPKLLLNYVPKDEKRSNQHYSIGLSIKHEIDSLLTEINKMPVETILVVYNNSSWAIRSKQLLEDAWGNMLINAYIDKPSNMTESIGAAVGTQASTARKETIEKLFSRRIEFLPRPRGDVDAIIVFISPSDSESLEPILKFHFLEDIPVFDSSQSELHNQTFDKLNVRSLEFPFISQNGNSYVFLKNQFGLKKRFNQELFALGMDSYRLLQLIDIFKVTPNFQLHGQTGRVFLNKKQEFVRQLKLTEKKN